MRREPCLLSLTVLVAILAPSAFCQQQTKQNSMVFSCFNQEGLHKALDIVSDVRQYVAGSYGTNGYSFYNKQGCSLTFLPESTQDKRVSASRVGFYRSSMAEQFADLPANADWDGHEPGFIFSIYRITIARAGRRPQHLFVSNGIYDIRRWKVAEGAECGSEPFAGQCLLPRSCDAIAQPRASSYLAFGSQSQEYTVPLNCSAQDELIF